VKLIRPLAYLSIATGMLCAHSQAAPYSPPALDLGYLYGQSELVFAGTLVSKAYDIDESGRPWTLFTFTDLDVLAGNHTKSDFSLRCPGGSYDGLARIVMHVSADIEVGERSLVFFDQDAWCQITAGGSYGEFKIVPATDTSKDELLVNSAGLGALGVTQAGFSWGNQRVWGREYSMDHYAVAPINPIKGRTTEQSWEALRPNLIDIGKRLFKYSGTATEPTGITGAALELTYAPRPNEKVAQ
jgi:hypothetical protein